MKIQSKVLKNQSVHLPIVGEVMFDSNGFCNKEVSQADGEKLCELIPHIEDVANPKKEVVVAKKSVAKKETVDEDAAGKRIAKLAAENVAKENQLNAKEKFLNDKEAELTEREKVIEAKEEELGIEKPEKETEEVEGDEETNKTDAINKIMKMNRKQLMELAAEYPEDETLALTSNADYKNYLIGKINE